GHVVDPTRHDHELAFVHPHVAVAELDQQPAFHDEKQLVLYVMVMPHELALDLDELHVGVIELTYDLRAPVVVELPELRREIHAVHETFPSWRSGGRAVWRTEQARLATARSCARTGSIRPRQESAPWRGTCARSPARAGSASRAARRSRGSRTRTCPRWWARRDARRRYRRCSPGSSRTPLGRRLHRCLWV